MLLYGIEKYSTDKKKLKDIINYIDEKYFSTSYFYNVIYNPGICHKNLYQDYSIDILLSPIIYQIIDDIYNDNIDYLKDLSMPYKKMGMTFMKSVYLDGEWQFIYD